MSNLDAEKVIQTQVDVQVIKAGQIETNRRLGNIERKMDSFSFTKQADFDEFRKHVADTYVTKDDFKPTRQLVWGVVTTVITAIVLAGLAAILRKP